MIRLALLKLSWEYSFSFVTLKLSKNYLSSITEQVLLHSIHSLDDNFAFFTHIIGSFFKEPILTMENSRLV